MSFETEKFSNDRDILVKQLLAEARKRFDIEEVQTNDEINRLLSEIQEIVDNGDTAKTIEEFTIENDFNDPIFANLATQLNSLFSKEFLQKCLISRITIRPDIIHLAIGKGIYLTLDEYQAWRQENPKIDEFKVRAENFTTFQTSGWLRENFDIDHPIPLPIVIYGFNKGEDENVDYLASFHPNARDGLYKLGTVTHEIGHHIFQFILTLEQREEFTSLATGAVPFTKYAKLYRNKEVYSEEQFCEAVRLMTTNSAYLKESVPQLYSWFANVLPEIHPVTPTT